jgi:hypothetical protein
MGGNACGSILKVLSIGRQLAALQTTNRLEDERLGSQAGKPASCTGAGTMHCPKCCSHCTQDD